MSGSEPNKKEGEVVGLVRRGEGVVGTSSLAVDAAISTTAALVVVVAARLIR